MKNSKFINSSINNNNNRASSYETHRRSKDNGGGGEGADIGALATVNCPGNWQQPERGHRWIMRRGERNRQESHAVRGTDPCTAAVNSAAGNCEIGEGACGC